MFTLAAQVIRNNPRESRFARYSRGASVDCGDKVARPSWRAIASLAARDEKLPLGTVSRGAVRARD
jgi:hypothetical protein